MDLKYILNEVHKIKVQVDTLHMHLKTLSDKEDEQFERDLSKVLEARGDDAQDLHWVTVKSWAQLRFFMMIMPEAFRMGVGDTRSRSIHWGANGTFDICDENGGFSVDESDFEPNEWQVYISRKRLRAFQSNGFTKRAKVYGAV